MVENRGCIQPSHQPPGCWPAFWHKQAQLEAEYHSVLFLHFGEYLVTGTKVSSLLNAMSAAKYAKVIDER